MFPRKRSLDTLARDAGTMRRLRQQIKSGLAALGYQVRGTKYCPRQLLDPELRRGLELDDVVCRRMFEVGRDFTFIQVGAFDGVSTDPLRKYIQTCGWRGVLIDPQPGPAAQLRELYGGNDRLIILQAALDDKRGTRTLFTVDSDTVPAWALSNAITSSRTPIWFLGWRQ
jgi:hypothetical protein